MFDRIIVSSDESYFIQYWSIVSAAWNKFFPGKIVTLAFVTNKNENDDYIKNLRQFGEVFLFKPVDGIPTGNQAKMARQYLASTFENEVCMIEDIDTIPLQSEFVNRVLIQREKGKILAVGHEVYDNSEHHGKFPTSNLTGEGFLFKEFINPNNLTFQNAIKSWINVKVYDHKEAINGSPDVFSDESLRRFLMKKWNPSEDKVTKAKRDVNIRTEWVDRSWWGINTRKLNEGKYVCCNFLRPFSQYYDEIEPIVEFIYGKKMKKEDVIL